MEGYTKHEINHAFFMLSKLDISYDRMHTINGKYTFHKEVMR